jgi:hypothetical protein
MQMVNRATLPLANVDFSLCVNIKTSQGGNIISNLPENRRWRNVSKALCVDPTSGVVKFISGENIVCESFSRVNDDKWHEIAVVYSNEDKRYIIDTSILNMSGRVVLAIRTRAE